MYVKLILLVLGELTPEQRRIEEILQERLTEGGLAVVTIEPLSPTCAFIFPLVVEDCQNLRRSVKAVCRELDIHVRGDTPQCFICTGASGVQCIRVTVTGGSNVTGGLPSTPRITSRG